MKKLVFLFLLGAALFLLANGREGRERIFSAASEEKESTVLQSHQVSNQEVITSEEKNPEAEAPRSGEKVLAARSIYFPNAPEISRLELPNAQGKELRRIVKTDLAEPYVEIREKIQSHDGHEIVVAQEAMVANQVLMPKPEGEIEETAVKLYSLGAQKVQEKGSALLITFAVDPSDPMAMEAFLAKVKSAFPQVVAIEPNYIRKLFSID